ncbi:MAG: hypothetical protein E5W89_20660 [Mesorhizobium sp.]|nr:MAG: hypothetical protein E5W89_20660 [Mesorhizobium sp.]
MLAIVFAWALKAAFVEPFAIASLMQVYFKTIEGQTPNPEWDHRLSAASRQTHRTDRRRLSDVADHAGRRDFGLRLRCGPSADLDDQPGW